MSTENEGWIDHLDLGVDRLFIVLDNKDLKYANDIANHRINKNKFCQCGTCYGKIARRANIALDDLEKRFPNLRFGEFRFEDFVKETGEFDLRIVKVGESGSEKPTKPSETADPEEPLCQ